MRGVEQGPGLHRLRWGRWAPEGFKTGGGQRWQNQRPGSAIQSLDEPDAGRSQWPDPGGMLERGPPEVDHK